MAQPVFDEHPLEEYFRQTGESAELMPGGAVEFNTADDNSDAFAQSSVAVRSLQTLVSRIVDTLLSSPKFSSHSNSFAERFKYDVISSSLLSNSIAATPHAGRRTFTPEIPGRLAGDSDSGHSRNSSLDHRPDTSRPSSATDAGGLQLPVTITSIAVVALSSEYYFVALFLLAGAAYMALAVKSTVSRGDAVSLTMNALNELISAGDVWDSAVNEAMMIVEKEERRPSPFYGPTSPRAPFSSLRVALQSSLHTTQTQCDNVRQLLSALTSPSQLSQLSEMYAPASPIRPSSISLEPHHSRPLSDPLTLLRRRTSSFPQNPTTNKRATWNGSYVSLAQAGSLPPTIPASRRRDKRRSDLSALFSQSSISAPASPQPPKVLADVQEEDGDSDDQGADLPELKQEYFGMAALKLRRKRRSAGMEVLGIPPPSYTSQSFSPPSPTPNHRHSLAVHAPSIASSSRFTLLQTSRHPLSLSALHLAVQGAIAAKRYACSHLLALRFEEEEEDEGYWEDVRSVMALLTSTFTDASERLVLALDEAEKKRIKDERPSPESSEPSSSPERNMKLSGRPMKSMAEMVSFAPMPSHLTRFAAHVDAISSALNDARTHLEQCVASLRDPHSSDTPSDIFAIDCEGISENNPTLQAYDRLRKELGFALRECERGRERLLDVLRPPAPVEEEDEDEEDPIDTPPLVADSSSEEFGSATSTFPSMLDKLSDVHNGFGLDLNVDTRPVDDATEHLLMSASSSHLPPPGIEQVFEADSGAVGLFTRERSKLSREDRIRIAKEKRKSSGRLPGTGSGEFAVADEGFGGRSDIERWGPGGEVVQELKDVIWKVGQRRRKMRASVGVEEDVEEDVEEGGDLSRTTDTAQAVDPVMLRAIQADSDPPHSDIGDVDPVNRQEMSSTMLSLDMGEASL